MNVTAVSADARDFQTPPVHRRRADGAGLRARPRREARRERAEVGARRRCRSSPPSRCEPGRYDLVLHPSHLLLTIHESIAHPTELDRIMGFEANYAGTSFVAPPEDYLGKFRYGPTIMNIQAATRSSPARSPPSAGTTRACGRTSTCIVKNGVFERPADHARAGAACWPTGTGSRAAGAQPRQPLRAELGRRAVPAHAQREPRCRTRRARRERWTSYRGDATTASHHRRRRRSPSTSSATTRSSAGRCSTRSRAARSPGCSRTSPTRCARPSSGTRWTCIGGPQQLLPRRRVQRRQGPALARPTRCATAARRPLPPGQRDQHGAEGMSDLRSLAQSAR